MVHGFNPKTRRQTQEFEATLVYIASSKDSQNYIVKSCLDLGERDEAQA